MYHQYFGLAETPFSIAVNPRYLFMSPRHRDALAHLLYGVGAGGGFILLTGEVGTGKTTINRCLLEQLPQDTDIAIILNPALNAQELLASACDELGIEYAGDTPTLKSLTDELQRYLLANHERGRKTVLLIDEAQHLDFDVLEQIRLLTNLETNSEKLLQIILIGQPELAELLSRPELRQLNQRITARYNLEPLNLEETTAYIRHRLQVAGMSPDREIFPPNVVRGIYRTTRGIPRLINVLCDRMLLGAYGRNRSRVDNTMLRQAIREVMGEDVSAPASVRIWNVAAAGVAVALLLVGLLWMSGAVDSNKLGIVAALATVANPAPTISTAAPAEPLPPNSQTESASTLPNNAVPGTVVHALQPAAALLLPGQATATLWALASSAAAPPQLCLPELYAGMQCVSGEALTWGDIARLDRPIVLSMVTAERFSAETLLLGITDKQAWVYTADGLLQVSLAKLAAHWTGNYHYLWRPPKGFEGPLARGSQDVVVSEIARLFAQLDGMEEPLAVSFFNENLEARVRYFQQQHALQADGVVGRRTLLKLNEVLGLDITAAVARDKLALQDEI